MAREKIDATTWKEVETVDDATFEVVIGDDKQPTKFEPQAKLQVQFPGGEANEVNFSARLVDWAPSETKSVVEDPDKLRSVVGGEYESRYYPKSGEYEFDLVLNKPQPSNVFTWTLQTKNLKAYFQPPLTQEEIDFGAERPDRVVGSYAFYHATKSNHALGGTNYRGGKAFHLYRPLVTDAAKKSIWADLWVSPNLDLMTVTVDLVWLAKATYPVVIDPDIGYTTVGGTNQTTVAGFWLLDIDDSGSAGTADTIKAYIAESQTPGTDPNIKAAFFKESDGVLQEVSSTVKTLSDFNFAWETFTLAGTTSIAASTGYIVAITADIGRGVHKYDTGSAGDGGYDGGASYSSPGNISLPIALDTRQCSFYLSYTVASGAVLAASVSTSVSVTGAISVPKPLAASISTSLTVTGALDVPKPLAASVSGAISVTGALDVPKPLAAAVSIPISIVGALDVPKPLAASVSIPITTTADLSIGGAGAVLAASVSVSLATQGALDVPKPLAASVSIPITTTADLTTPGVGAALAASVSIPISIAGGLDVPKPLAASVSIPITASADLTTGIQLAGSISVPVSVVGALDVPKPLAASVSIPITTRAGLTAPSAGVDLDALVSITISTEGLLFLPSTLAVEDGDLLWITTNRRIEQVSTSRTIEQI